MLNVDKNPENCNPLMTATQNPLFLTGHVHELRVLRTRQGTCSGYFNDPDLMYRAAAELDGQAPGIYSTLNPVNPVLLARANNRLQAYAKSTTSDADIVRRCWMLIDCDAVRPSDISSSESEHEAALDRARDLRAWLAEQGWPEPVFCDSGNGSHLLYRIDLPNSNESTSLIKGCLESLSFKFDDAVVVVDRGVFNPARITKLYGSMSCKGDSTEDRPHRRSQILTVPDDIQIVERDQLQQLAALRPVEQKPNGAHHDGRKFDLPAFMQRYNLAVSREKPFQGGVICELERCPFNSDHTRSASIVQFPSGAVSFQCFHNSCQAFHWQELRDLLEPNRAHAAIAELPEEESPYRGPCAPMADPEWPVLDPAALHGLAGEAVRLLSPHTEADEVALLTSFLAEIGAMLNRGPHLILDGSFHPLLFWPINVGASSKSRKGTAGKRIEGLIRLVEPVWMRGECKGTLSSGEGLAFAVRDPQYQEQPLKERGQPTGETVTVCVDLGVEDKRLFLVQAEFGSVLRIMGREGNSLSGVLRDAWDGLTLAPMTKANRVKATDPHIGIVGHVTRDELLRNLTDTETVNGFGNRFCWFLVRRSKELPFPSAPSESDLATLAAKIGKALVRARQCGALSLTPAACDAWQEIYSDLSADRPGMAGALLGRAEAQVMRISGLYAVLAGQAAIDLPHLRAGLALWQHAEASTRLIFGDSLGDSIADTILRALRTTGEQSDSQISDLFGRHLAASRLERSKTVLLTAGLAHCATVETAGRPRIVWRAGAKKAREAK